MNATQEWNFATEADAALHPKGPKPQYCSAQRLLMTVANSPLSESGSLPSLCAGLARKQLLILLG